MRITRPPLPIDITNFCRGGSCSFYDLHSTESIL